MDIGSLSDDDRAQLAADVAAELDTGRYGNRFVLSRRQLLTIAGGSAGVAGLTALGVDPAAAQSAAGQVGTASSPEDVFAYDLDVQNGATFSGTDLSGVGSLSTGSISTGRTWTDMTGNRSVQTDYVADGDTYVSIQFEFNTTNRSQASLFISGSNRDSQIRDTPDTSDELSVTGLVPDGATYRFNESGGALSIVEWHELS